MPTRLPKRLQQWHAFAEAAGHKYGVDPLLILAIMDRESLGGYALEPRGPQGYGDCGHAHGLMAIDDRSHAVFLGERLPDGTPAWANPQRNIDYGAKILHDNLIIFQGDEFLAAAAYNAGAHAVQRALLSLSTPATPARRHEAVDAVTTHRYASDVLERRNQLRIKMNTPEEPQNA